MTFNHKTIDELHDLLVKKEISALELTKATLADIKSRENAVDAFLTITEDEALAQAAALDKKGIDADNVMAGIPFAVKDNISTKGILTTAASKMLYNYEPIFDATAVSQAYDAGMIVIGKTNMDEFAMGGSNENSAFKPTKNAWDQAKVSGGSSGGSAAAVASGQVRLSLGSDTGGSIRQPAAFNGIVGMKPTYGTVSRFGLIAFGSSLDQIGPFSQTVKENAQLLNVISGHDAKDATSILNGIADFTSKIGQDIKGLKIALPKEYIGEGIDPQVKETILKAAKHLESLGAIIEEVSLPHSKYGVAVYYIIASSEASSNLQRFDGIRYGFRAPDATNLEEIYVKTRSQGFGEEVKRRIMLGTFSLSSGYYDAYFKKAGQVRTLIIQDFEKVFANYDLILGPTAPTVAFDLDTLNHDPVAMYLADLLTIPVNLAGLPGLSIPAGFVEGLPVGLQLIGPKYSEETIYQVAAAFEATTDYHKQQPVIFGGANK
ncbi:Asp-tRNA(Asn)/Glu-tRNA(Gln) amidotransferase subunit GatA [Streptococcus ruminantium]|uniref:Glutamyl-tRNA(Gln) amidotransferase subunit A n=1 Tax=Streptococcus ruminantium TaxID=1917441 RepID=A0A2Z5TKQ1_9STRE|nr:Asp-tRNA(Asn)/Glu-tRNA(Gln) amidotransferase subunit GatA [Streptococcus ruminantium]BBA91979.1 Asp-tRNA(Asn)/Glu-tRNA(Gln) amidotransferase subunit [Streptococcus ruminantium]